MGVPLLEAPPGFEPGIKDLQSRKGVERRTLRSTEINN